MGRFVGVYNVTPGAAPPWPGSGVHELGVADSRDLVTGEALPWDDHGTVWLPPYGVLWLTGRRPPRPR